MLNRINVIEQPFNPWQQLQEHEDQLSADGRCGAVASFVGKMRDFNEGDDVQGMFLEHYPEMTTQYLQQLADTASQRWGLLGSLVVHRVGEIQPNQTIVLTAAWSSHRAEALLACQFLIEELKHNAPFWKRETLVGGQTRWVERNTPGVSGLETL